MTRKQLHEKIETGDGYRCWHNAHEIADEMFDEFENVLCDGCEYKSERDGIDPFPMRCSVCRRFYPDMWEESEHKEDKNPHNQTKQRQKQRNSCLDV